MTSCPAIEPTTSGSKVTGTGIEAPGAITVPAGMEPILIEPVESVTPTLLSTRFPEPKLVISRTVC